MGAAFFYHMTRTPLGETLPVLLTKSLGAGWRVLLRPQTDDRAAWLDDFLWTYAEDSFLPHGRDHDHDDPARDLHPIWISPTAAFDRDALVSVDGAVVTPAEVAASTRTMILFDGDQPDAVQAARVQWKTLTAGGCAAQYWSQDSGAWQMKAEAQATGNAP